VKGRLIGGVVAIDLDDQCLGHVKLFIVAVGMASEPLAANRRTKTLGDLRRQHRARRAGVDDGADLAPPVT
jgi:hypothetical protein